VRDSEAKIKHLNFMPEMKRPKNSKEQEMETKAAPHRVCAQKAPAKSPNSSGQRARARHFIPRADGKPGRGTDIGWHDKFLHAIGQEPNISRACRIVRIDRKTATAHRDKFSGFAIAWDEAIEASTDDLESTAIRISTRGIRRLKFDKDGDALNDPKTGRPYEEIEYPVALMCFLLKSRRKETYGDKLDVSSTQKPMSDEEALRMGELAADGLVSTIRASIGYRESKDVLVYPANLESGTIKS
jgi:hypothetical protein